MKKGMVAASVAVLIAIPGAGHAMPLGESAREPEGCQAVNPGQPTCTFTSTQDMEGPVAGVAGVGSWIVKVKRGKKTIKIKSPASGEPTAMEFLYETGDKVTATALSPGSGLAVGGD